MSLLISIFNFLCLIVIFVCLLGLVVCWISYFFTNHSSHIVVKDDNGNIIYMKENKWK